MFGTFCTLKAWKQTVLRGIHHANLISGSRMHSNVIVCISYLVDERDYHLVYKSLVDYTVIISSYKLPTCSTPELGMLVGGRSNQCSDLN
jgi:hypothetical protein